MSERPRRDKLLFWFRFALLFAVCLMPVPWLADAYSSVFARGVDVALAIVNRHSSVRFHVEPPEHLRVRGSWKPTLRIEEARTGETKTLQLNLRTFSFLPIATFLALALASPLIGWRRNLVVLAAGLGSMVVITTFLASLPILMRFVEIGAFGGTVAATLETSYQALATPVMMFFIPFLVWWLLMWLTREKAPAW
jgi:hypothetical protein